MEKGVKAVGIDYLSIDGFGQHELRAHVVLLGAAIPVVEGLDLSDVGAGLFEFVCLPLRVEGGEAALRGSSCGRCKGVISSEPSLSGALTWTTAEDEHKKHQDRGH